MYGSFAFIYVSSPELFLLAVSESLETYNKGASLADKKADNESGIQEEAMVTETPQEHASREDAYLVSASASPLLPKMLSFHSQCQCLEVL